jgi:peptidoglycan/LPS O-acetylase OafA/YrhL
LTQESARPSPLEDGPLAFGMLRLLLAAAVVIGHMPEMVDGNRSREPLTLVFGTLSLGELAVDGFFIISGFLITASYLRSRSVDSYLRRRVARIYPAFIVAFLICAFIVPLLAGAVDFVRPGAAELLKRMALLRQPGIEGVFAALKADNVNGAMWSISHEFRCYLLVILIGFTGVLMQARWLAPIGIALLSGYILLPDALVEWLIALPLGSVTALATPRVLCRTIGLFLCGAAFYLAREKISFDRKWVMLASALALVGLCFRETAHLAVGTFGAYLIFGVAAWAGRTPLGRINERTDISYGLYLYAWPAGQLLILHQPGQSVMVLTVQTLAIAALMGWLSWHLVEKHFLLRARGEGRTPGWRLPFWTEKTAG